MAGTYTEGDTSSTVYHQPAMAGGPGSLPGAGSVYPTGPSGYVQAAGAPRSGELSGADPNPFEHCAPCQDRRQARVQRNGGLGSLGRALFLGQAQDDLSPGAFAAASLIGGSAGGALIGYIASSEVEGAITGGMFSGGITGLSNATMFIKKGKGAAGTLMLLTGLGALGWSLWRFRRGLG